MFNRLTKQLNNKIEAVKSTSPRRLYFLGALLVFFLVYFLWCKYSPKPVPVRDYVPAPTAKPVADLPKVPVVGPKQLFVFDKAKAGKKLDIPEAEANNNSEQIGAAVDVRPGKNAVGSRVVTFVNTTTGQMHSVAKDIPREWLSFERGNELGAGYGLGRDGQAYAVRYRRDILRVGSVYIVGEVEGNQTTGRGAEGKVSAWAVYRW